MYGFVVRLEELHLTGVVYVVTSQQSDQKITTLRNAKVNIPNHAKMCQRTQKKSAFMIGNVSKNACITKVTETVSTECTGVHCARKSKNGTDIYKKSQKYFTKNHKNTKIFMNEILFPSNALREVYPMPHVGDVGKCLSQTVQLML